MATKKIGEGNSRSAELVSQYREYLDGLNDEVSADQELKPGSKAFVKLRELSDRLDELAEQDFQAKQLKMEIDRALAAAADGGGGGLLQAFAAVGKKSDDDDRFE